MRNKDPHPRGRVVNDTIAVFDLDGCISDNSWRVARQTVDPKSYHEACLQDPAIEVGKALVQAHIDQGDFIIFASDRPFAYAEQTSEWLQKQFNILPFHDFTILMRRDGDERIEPELKKEFAGFIQQMVEKENLTIANVYDDNEAVVSFYKSVGFPASVLDSSGVRTPEVVANDIKFVDTPESMGSTPQPIVINIGRAMSRLFPQGVMLRTEEDFNGHLAFVSTLAQMIKPE